MRVKAQTSTTSLMAAGLVTIASLGGTTAAQAQMVFFEGFTNGCFNGMPPCTPVPNPGFQGATVGGDLGWQNSQFAGTTVGGSLSMGAAPTAPGTQNVDNFGSFMLTPNPRDYTGHTFTLLISFTSPSAHGQLFQAALSGIVMGSAQGGVYINFPNNEFFWTVGDWTYSVAINDVDVTSPNPGTPFSSAPITGRLTATQTQVIPEPMTMVLLGTGLLALGAVRRRRGRAQDADIF